MVPSHPTRPACQRRPAFRGVCTVQTPRVLLASGPRSVVRAGGAPRNETAQHARIAFSRTAAQSAGWNVNKEIGNGE